MYFENVFPYEFLICGIFSYKAVVLFGGGIFLITLVLFCKNFWVVCIFQVFQFLILVFLPIVMFFEVISFDIWTRGI